MTYDFQFHDYLKLRIGPAMCSPSWGLTNLPGVVPWALQAVWNSFQWYTCVAKSCQQGWSTSYIHFSNQELTHWHHSTPAVPHAPLAEVVDVGSCGSSKHSCSGLGWSDNMGKHVSSLKYFVKNWSWDPNWSYPKCSRWWFALEPACTLGSSSWSSASCIPWTFDGVWS